MNLKRTLHIIGSANMGGGAERYLIILCNGLKKIGYNNIFVCSDGQYAQIIRNLGYKVYCLDLRKKQLSVINSLYNIIKKEKVDIVHAHSYYGVKRGLIASKLAGVPISVATMHIYINVDDNRNPKINFPYWVYNKLLTYLPDRLIAVSKSIKEHTLNQLKINPEKVVTVYNGIDLENIQLSESNGKQKIIKEFNLVSNEKYIGIIARLDIEKGHRYLFQAISLLVNDIENLKLFVVGDGYARNDLKKLAQKLGILDKVIFTGLRLDAVAIMSCMDLVVVPSLAEPFGLVITEAMALSKPVIASNTGAIPEIVLDGKTGILVPPKNDTALAQAIIKLLKDKKLAQEMGQAGKKRVYERFVADVFVKNTAAVYEKIAAEKFGAI